MFSKLYKFSKFVMYLNSCSMDLGRDNNKNNVRKENPHRNTGQTGFRQGSAQG